MTGAPYDPRVTPARPDLAAAYLADTVAAARYADGEAFHVNASAAALRQAPRTDAPLLSELLHGETVTIYETRGDWAWGQAARDGYVGYLRRDALAPGARNPTHVVTTLFAQIYAAPDLKAPVRLTVPLAGLLVVARTEEEEPFAPLAAEGGWVSRRQIAALSTPARDPVAVAELFLGAPYLWGGRTALGLDCSALVQLALTLAGIALPRDSDLQLAACREDLATPVARTEARRGDLAFFPGHVGIMCDATRLVHANATHMAVSIDPLSEVVARLGRDHDPSLLGLYRPRARILA
ncbi:MAG: peptidase P60 [Alphaproteobacteria bacterium]|nr:MAG: peptidase P60 [Alphaproteobacteria bacterium]